MNPARIFALQSQKISNQDNIPGGITEIDQATAAGLCSGMRRSYYLAGRLKWGKDLSVVDELNIKLLEFTKIVGRQESWDLSKITPEKLSTLAILEMLEPFKYKEDIKKANYLGVHKSNFSRTWNKRYNIIYQELDDLANRAFSYIMMKQRYEKN